jgi:hypothetical protein
MKARVHRLSAAAPDDTGELQQLIDEEQIIPQNIVAILGKTEAMAASMTLPVLSLRKVFVSCWLRS